ncbi:Hypothetical predicted protein [Mytilus galloprovincialis]|uniref:RNase H type-1 domain-containing protein n=1 Tax=Mytilus galloprovincialis TaxID=29158 RepID=A0A8B6GIS7_MYTGA|nr:Hypothetical predicted protein [Mytilus galloprovincialis]
MMLCMENIIPKTTRNIRKHHKPCWWNKTVEEKKHLLNKCQREFKLKNTPTNLTKLMEAESSFTDAKDEAVDEWSALLCTQLNGSKNLKEKWSNFKKLTKKNENNFVLPFLDSNGNILFEEEDKEKILEDTFFKGNHLNANNFDNDFYTEIMEKYINITLSEEVEEEGYMNEEISRDELEGSIAKLKKNSAPGPDNIFTELIINAGDSLISTLLHIFNKSIEEGRIPIQWKRANVKFLKKSRNKKHPGTVHLVLGNQPIKYNPNPKLLGVTLDEKLTFSEHINIIEKKAGKSLGILREIKGIGNIKTKFLIQVYNSIIGSIFLYASCIWQTGKEEHLKKLNAIQRKGLSICLGVSATASLEVLQVMAGVLPLDLRREEMAIRDIARLNSYSTKIPIRNKIDEWKNKETVDKFISPLGLMLQQAKNMKEETDISIDDIEPEYQFQGLQASKSPPEYWRTLGSSKNRTKEQEITGKNLILNKLNTVSPSTVVAFTDGSCQSNPGPCGAGAIVIFNNKEIELKQPVSKRGSILLAELVAIKLVLDYVSRIENKTLIEKDSQ